MTPRELIEMSSLDLLGFLDDADRAAFEKALRAASPEVQAQVRAQQLLESDVDRILPDVAPPMGFKGKVMATVRDAIAAVEPVARIGPGGRRFSYAAPVWRAACIGFATASLVLGGFAWRITSYNREIQSLAINNNVQDELRSRGAGVEFVQMLTSRDFQRVSFSPAAQDYAGRAEASIMVNPAANRAYLICNSLPQGGGKCRLMAQTGDDAREIAEFIAAPGTFFIKLEGFDVKALVNTTLRLDTPHTDGSKRETLLVSKGV